MKLKTIVSCSCILLHAHGTFLSAELFVILVIISLVVWTGSLGECLAVIRSFPAPFRREMHFRTLLRRR